MFIPFILGDLKNPFSTNKLTVLLLCISPLISSYMFGLNYRLQGANTYIVKTYSNTIVLGS